MRTVLRSFPGGRAARAAAPPAPARAGAAAGLVLAAAAGSAFAAPIPAPDRPAPKRPQAVAAVIGPDGERVLVGNRDGTVQAVSAERLEVLAEIPVGGNLTGLTPLPDGRIVAVDRAGDRLVALRLVPDAEGAVAVAAAYPTCRSPARAAAGGRILAVSCLWARTVALYDLESADGLERPRASAQLPFEPRELVFLDERTVLAADAFGGGLALLSAEDGAVLRTRELAAHNLRGLALLPGGERVAVAHQHLHSGMHTTSDDIRWGVFITNSVTTLPVEDLLTGSPRLERRSRVLDLGSVATPSGDPAALRATPEGELVVALGGVSRVAFGAADARRTSHLPVGEGPSAVALGADRRVYVANTRSDSLSVITAGRRREAARVALGPAVEPSAEERGEALFHDATLSLRGWMSCASCHTDGHTNHRLSDTLGDGNYGAPKRVLSLLGVADTRPYAWDGGMRRLEDQVVKSVKTTLRGRALTEGEVADLAAYLRTLEVPALGGGAPPAPRFVAAGRAAFDRYACNRCHREPTYTSPGVHDVGLADELGTTRFNPPSLRGLRFGRRFFHDGSARSLREVLARHPGNGVEVSGEDLPALVAFLKTL